MEEKKDIIIRGDRFDLKIDSNRYVYTKNNKEDKVFRNLYHKVPIGWSRSQKNMYLLNLKTQISQELDSLNNENKEKGELKDENEND